MQPRMQPPIFGLILCAPLGQEFKHLPPLGQTGCWWVPQEALKPGHELSRAPECRAQSHTSLHWHWRSSTAEDNSCCEFIQRKTAGGAALQQVGYLVHVLSLMKILHSNRKSLTFQRMRSLTINFPWQSALFFCKNGILLRAQCCLVYISSCFNCALQNMLIYLYEASWKLYCLNLFYVLIWKKNKKLLGPPFSSITFVIIY